MARDINPEADIGVFSHGVNGISTHSFATSISTSTDSTFAFDARERVFAYCSEHGIPAVTVAPLGMSAALLNFLPGEMTFEDYFQVSGRPELDKAIRFLVGLAPALLHRHYLADPSRVNLKGAAVRRRSWRASSALASPPPGAQDPP